MVPLIMAALSLAQQKAQAEKQDLQNMQQNMQNPIQMSQYEIPSINSVFGR